MQILVTGATGLLGPYLAGAFASLGKVATTARAGGVSHRADLTDRIQVRTLLERVRPDLVVHAAALTDVDRCQREPDLAMLFNRDMAANLALEMERSARMVLISSDQVYPDVPGPHAEEEVDPINVYGATKLAGETPVLGRGNSLVVRTNIFGPSRTTGRASLSDFFVRSFMEKRPVTLFSDIRFSPLLLKTTARYLVKLVRAEATGVFNLGSRDGMSKADFAYAVARHLGLDASGALVAEGASVGDAPRLRDMRLAVEKVERELGEPLPTLLDEIGLLPPVAGAGGSHG